MENVFEPMANFNQEKFEPLENFAGEIRKMNESEMSNLKKSRIDAVQSSKEYRDLRKKLINDVIKNFSENEKKAVIEPIKIFGVSTKLKSLNLKKALSLYSAKNKKPFEIDLKLYSLDRIPNLLSLGFSPNTRFIKNPRYLLHPFNRFFNFLDQKQFIGGLVKFKNKQPLFFENQSLFEGYENFEADDSFEGDDYSNFDEMYFEGDDYSNFDEIYFSGDDYSNFEEAYSNFGWFSNFRKKAGSFLNPVSRFKFLRDKVKEGYNRLRGGRNNDNKVIIAKRLGGIKQIFEYQKRLMSLKDEADRKQVVDERKNKGFSEAIILADKILKEKNLPIRNSNEILSIKKSSFEGMEYFDDMSSFDDFDTFEGDEYFEGDDFSNFGLVEWFKSKFGKKDISTQSTPTSISQEKKVFGMPRKTAIGVGVGLIAVGITAFFLIKKKK